MKKRTTVLPGLLLAALATLPLQAATVLGFVFSIVAFLALPVVIVTGEGSTILFVVLLLGGIQLITVGLIGEYVGRIYDEVKQRPLYLVRERRNLAAPEHAEEASEQIVTR